MTADDLAKILDELGRRLGPTGSHVFDLAVRQVYINGLTATVLLVLTVGCGIVGGRRLYGWVQDGDTDDRGMVAVIIGVFYGLAAVCVAIAALISIPNMFNPEYAALRDLLGAVSRTVR